MSLTETRTKLLSGSEVCPPGYLPSPHCIITSNYIVVYNIYYAYKYLPFKLYASGVDPGGRPLKLEKM